MLTEAVDRALSADEIGIARAAALALLQLRYTTDAHAVQESIGRQESMVELVEQEIPELEAMGDDRALVRAFRLLTYVHWTGCPLRLTRPPPPSARSGMRPPPATR